jgi:hypothetical protein
MIRIFHVPARACKQALGERRDRSPRRTRRLLDAVEPGTPSMSLTMRGTERDTIVGRRWHVPRAAVFAVTSRSPQVYARSAATAWLDGRHRRWRTRGSRCGHSRAAFRRASAPCPTAGPARPSRSASRPNRAPSALSPLTPPGPDSASNAPSRHRRSRVSDVLLLAARRFEIARVGRAACARRRTDAVPTCLPRGRSGRLRGTWLTIRHRVPRRRGNRQLYHEAGAERSRHVLHRVYAKSSRAGRTSPFLRFFFFFRRLPRRRPIAVGGCERPVWSCLPPAKSRSRRRARIARWRWSRTSPPCTVRASGAATGARAQSVGRLELPRRRVVVVAIRVSMTEKSRSVLDNYTSAVAPASELAQRRMERSC